MNCSNCGAKLSCSCKVRIASDKKSCCTACLGGYEVELARKRNAGKTVPEQATNVKVLYDGPGKQH